MTERLLYTVQQTQWALNISGKTLYALVKAGDLQPIKLFGDKRTWFAAEDLRALVAKRKEAGKLLNVKKITALSVESRKKSGPAERERRKAEADELLEGLGWN
jgi:hypothetical protein